jgi:hypothetical protein
MKIDDDTYVNLTVLTTFLSAIDNLSTPLPTSLSTAMLWLLINTVAGLKFELAIFDGHHTLGTIIFYAWFIGSFIVMLKLFKGWWKAHL